MLQRVEKASPYILAFLLGVIATSVFGHWQRLGSVRASRLAYTLSQLNDKAADQNLSKQVNAVLRGNGFPWLQRKIKAIAKADPEAGK